MATSKAALWLLFKPECWPSVSTEDAGDTEDVDELDGVALMLEFPAVVKLLLLFMEEVVETTSPEADCWLSCFFLFSNSSRIFRCWSILAADGLVNALPVVEAIVLRHNASRFMPISLDQCNYQVRGLRSRKQWLLKSQFEPQILTGKSVP